MHASRQANGQPAPRPPKDEARQRAQFATGMARSEFGRFYWSGKLDRALQAAMQRKPSRKPNGAKR